MIAAAGHMTGRRAVAAPPAIKTRATRCITANVLQTDQVDAQCDKFATELS